MVKSVGFSTFLGCSWLHAVHGRIPGWTHARKGPDVLARRLSVRAAASSLQIAVDYILAAMTVNGVKAPSMVEVKSCFPTAVASTAFGSMMYWFECSYTLSTAR